MSGRRVARALVFACVAVAAAAHAQSPAALGELGGEIDSDHFSTVRARAGALFGFQSERRYGGIAAQSSHYAQSGWSRDAPALLGLWRDQSLGTGAGASAQIGVVEVTGHTRAIGDVDWALRPSDNTGVELLAAAGLVETRPAIEQGIAYSFWGAALEQRLAPRWTFVGLAAIQPFTDGNARSHLRLRAIWDALPEEGVNLQVRWRQYHDSRPGSASYFDPERYGQWLGVVGFRRRVSGWTTSGALGAGQEIIDQDGTTTTKASYLAELAAEGPVAGSAHLVVTARYSRAAGFSNSPQYWWASLGAALVVPF